MVSWLCFRLYPRLDASRPEGAAESIAKETIQTLNKLVVQFTRDVVRCAITLRELDFALRAHTKVWRLGERVLRPPHVRRAVELCGGEWLSMHLHFERLAERFSEGGESDGDDEDDVPLVVRARMRKAKAVASDEDEDDSDRDIGAGERDQQQEQTGPSKDSQAHEDAWQRWPSSHRAIYSPFIYAPDLIAPAHPFGVYAPGTMPEQPERGHPDHVAYKDDDNNGDSDDDEDEERDLMPVETDEEALEIELNAEDRLDTADARAAVLYEAGVWRELESAHHNAGTAPLRRWKPRKRRRVGAEVEVGSGDGEGDDDDEQRMRLRTRKRRKNVHGGSEEADLEMMLQSPDGVKAKSAAVIVDSGSDSEYLG